MGDLYDDAWMKDFEKRSNELIFSTAIRAVFEIQENEDLHILDTSWIWQMLQGDKERVREGECIYLRRGSKLWRNLETHIYMILTECLKSNTIVHNDEILSWHYLMLYIQKIFTIEYPSLCHKTERHIRSNEKKGFYIFAICDVLRYNTLQGDGIKAWQGQQEYLEPAKRCSRCKLVYYLNEHLQRLDADHHEDICLTLTSFFWRRPHHAKLGRRLFTYLKEQQKQIYKQKDEQ